MTKETSSRGAMRRGDPVAHESFTPLREADRFAICVDDAHVTRAAAVHTVGAGANLFLRRERIALEETARRHDVPRRADAALEGGLVDESLLDRVQRVRPRKTFDCADV